MMLPTTPESASFAGLTGAFLLAFPALFSMVNPLGAALVFAEVTAGRSRQQRAALARKVAIYGFLILFVSLWVGSALLHFFGITLGALRIGGGLVVASRAWSLLQAPEANEAHKERQASQDGRTAAAEDTSEIAFFPLTMPFTVGPGSISVAIALSAERPQDTGLPPLLGFAAGVTLAALLVCITVWIAYAGADRITRLLGRNGTRIVNRLVAFILLCIGVQIMASGVQDILTPILTQPPYLSSAPTRCPADEGCSNASLGSI